MALKDGEMVTFSLLGTVMLTGALFFPVLYWTEKADAKRPDFGDMESIEASIAYKKTPQKQPQKQVKAPDPVVKPDGVSRDEKKPPVETCDPKCKPGFYCDPATKQCRAEDKPPKKADTDPLAKYKRPDPDDDSPVGKPTVQPGDFNGSEFGWAPQTKGHPFWQKFAQDIHENFSLPSISEANGIPVGCFHITPDGKIADTQFKTKSGSADLDDAAQRAIDAVKKLRNENPIPVPTELLGATTRWICVRFDPKQAS
jgi:outer membrane biosynthesis protein TonB